MITLIFNRFGGSLSKKNKVNDDIYELKTFQDIKKVNP